VIRVGNDVVDLEDPRTEGRATDDRFLGRVFDPDEQAAILRATDVDLELWCRWAAKEAGYKVVSKLLGEPPPFVHHTFKVQWATSDEGADAGAVREGFVSHQGLEARVSVHPCPGGVHAVGPGAPGGVPEGVALQPRVALLDDPDAPWAGEQEELETRLTEAEREAVYSRQSAAVRLGARADLARALDVEERRLEIVCAPGPSGRRPPMVLLDGEQAPADVSLSHDGRWLAWVLWVRPDTE
jgi:phosphopantetheinyl transferase (holo-ACP synthase)